MSRRRLRTASSRGWGWRRANGCHDGCHARWHHKPIRTTRASRARASRRHSDTDVDACLFAWAWCGGCLSPAAAAGAATELGLRDGGVVVARRLLAPARRRARRRGRARARGERRDGDVRTRARAPRAGADALRRRDEDAEGGAAPEAILVERSENGADRLAGRFLRARRRWRGRGDVEMPRMFVVLVPACVCWVVACDLATTWELRTPPFALPTAPLHEAHYEPPRRGDVRPPSRRPSPPQGPHRAFWFSGCWNGCWRALAKGTAWAGFLLLRNTTITRGHTTQIKPENRAADPPPSVHCRFTWLFALFCSCLHCLFSERGQFLFALLFVLSHVVYRRRMLVHELQWNSERELPVSRGFAHTG